MAVALGVGVAMASGTGVVWAQDDSASVDTDNESQQTNSVNSPEAETATDLTKAAQQPNASPDERIAAPPEPPADSKGSLKLDDGVVISANGEVRSGAQTSQNDGQTKQNDESAEETVAKGASDEEEPGSSAQPAPPQIPEPMISEPLPEAAPKRSQSEAVVTVKDDGRQLGAVAMSIEPPASFTSFNDPPARIAVPVVNSTPLLGARIEPIVTSLAHTVPASGSIVVGAAPTTPTEPASVVTRVLATLLDAFSSGSPELPVNSPVMWVLAAAASRRFGAGPDIAEAETFKIDDIDNSLMLAAAANSAPTVDFVASPPTKTGVIKGQLIANDPEGDRLTYAGSTMTAKGSVVVDRKGRVTYTPTTVARHNAAAPDAALTGAGEDNFTLTVDDGQGNSVQVPVSVTILPANSAPTNGAVSLGKPNPVTGEVTGTLTARDRDGDDLSFSGPLTTSKGSITYNSANDAFTYTPTLEARQAASIPKAAKTAKTDTFTVTISDGYGGTGTVTVNVAIAPIAPNQPPTVTTSSGATSYTEQAAPKTIDSGLTLADADNSTLTGATISVGSPNSAETLAFTAPAGSGITGSYNSATGQLTLTGTSSVANYQTALRSVTYQNTSDIPATTRTVTFIVNDGASTSTAATKTVAVTGVNDAPTITTSTGATSYPEQGPPTVIDTGLTLADPDNTTLAGATVSIGSASSTETLAFTAPAGSGITGSYNSATGQLTLTGTSSVANYQTALRSVTYRNTSDTPDATRTISFTVSDGSTLSTAGTKTVTVTTVDGAPTVTTSAGATSYTEQAAPKVIDTGLNLSDADSTTLSGATVSIGSASSTETLAFTAPAGSGITGSYNSATGQLTLTGTSSVANYQTALRSVTYR
ncbi:Ig-like domain-containing protein, partial [Mycobacterium sp. 852002-51152_SCH6134967]|uniref:Ig-like domain-containing protein n=1 Tax=Mycobacterium sp. 852002-51152_SCH6134967 TaxID=1834096 RepID=UPI001E404B97